jgi:hypothetical protein
MDLKTILIVAAVILFLLDGFHIATGLNCTALGFACLAATLVTNTNALTVIAVAAGVLVVVMVLNAFRTRRPQRT